VAITDPVGVSLRWRPEGARAGLAVDALAGWRVLCADDGCQLPGPLVGADALFVTPVGGRRVVLGLGLGLGAGWLGEGCWDDALDRVCVEDGAAFSLIARVPLMASMRIRGGFELGAMVVPAWRLTPARQQTILGGLVLRWWP
jgi:hypothetical protein